MTNKIIESVAYAMASADGDYPVRGAIRPYWLARAEVAVTEMCEQMVETGWDTEDVEEWAHTFGVKLVRNAR